ARSNYPADAFFRGSLEGLQIWNTARSRAQIRMDMNELTGKEPGLRAYYPMDEASGNLAFDRTANGFHATLTSTMPGDQPAWVADPGGGPGRAVATFTTGDPAAQPSDFTATITWGDGQRSAGTITSNGRGGFNVTGSNRYAAADTYTILVEVRDALG